MLPQAPVRIVIVDDDPQILALLHSMLSLEGFAVITAEDGPSALAAIRAMAGDVALLLTDIEMRPTGGTVLAQRATAEFPDIRVLFMSGSFATEPGLKQLVPGCGFVKKPFAPAALMEAIRALMRTLNVR